MAGHQGLHRVVKTVKGKKGSTHRAYWVKNEQGPAAHPGIMHRAAVGAAKVGAVALAGAATLAAVAYGAHKLSSNMAAHGGGGAGRTHGLSSGLSPAHQAALHSAHASLNSAKSSVQNRVSEHINNRNANSGGESRISAALQGLHSRIGEHVNKRNAADHAARNAAPSHPGIVRRSAKRSK